MKNKLFVFLVVVSIAQTSAAQNVGIGTNTPNPAALLDVSSTTKGVLVPRMNTVQMNGIGGPNGLLVYNTDSAAFAYSDDGWVYLKGTTNVGINWNTKGNVGTNSSTDFIGTTDGANLVFKSNNERAGLIDGFLNNTS